MDDCPLCGSPCFVSLADMSNNVNLFHCLDCLISWPPANSADWTNELPILPYTRSVMSKALQS